MMRAVEASEPFLPAGKPRFAMGLGTPPQLLEMIRARRGHVRLRPADETGTQRNGILPDGYTESKKRRVRAGQETD